MKVTAGVTALVAALGALAIAGVFSGGGSSERATSFKTGAAIGIPGLESLGDVAGGVGLTALPQLRSRGPMDTIMQDDATFIYGATDEAVAKALERAKQLGVDRIRLTAGWSVLAPEADDDQKPSFDASDPSAYTKNGWKHYDPIGHWQALDRAVRATVAAGMTPMIDLGFWAPKWATSGDPRPARRTYNIDPHDYAEFVKAVVRRYSGGYVPKYGAPPPPSQTHSSDSDFLHSAFGSQHGTVARSSATSAPTFPFDLLGGAGASSGAVGSAASGSSSQGSPQAAGAAPEPAAPPLPRVSTWTIWNEPNHKGFVQPQWRKQGSRLVPSSPYIYRALVDAAYPAIKELQPDAMVLVGGTSSMGSERPASETDGEPPLVFLRALACVDRKLRPITSGPCANFKPLPGDGYAHHPYSLLHTPDWSDKKHPDYVMMGDISRLTGTLGRLAAMHRIDPAVRNVWLTEYGYESNPPDPIKPFSPAEQANLINWAEYLAWKNPQIESFPQFLLQDMGKVSAAEAAGGKRDYADWQSGLYFNDGAPKPAATSFALSLHVDCTRDVGGKRAKLVVIWGHVRPGRGPRQVTMESGKDAFRPAATAASLSGGIVRAASVTPFTTDANGYFLRFAPYRAGVDYRFSYRDAQGQSQTGLASPPDSCSGVTRQKPVRRAGANEF
ncbi:MAG TPA: hypothetical protein VE570_01315 [Thermoleophilaceae bacterium]|nr:hypothetical protein [Thermoleophilaceae bacterium]